MTYNVVILKSARYEYESIVGYLAQILKNPRAAGNFVAEFEYQLDLLREQPLLRPLSHMQELAARNYRSFPINNYVCLYKFEHETISVLLPSVIPIFTGWAVKVLLSSVHTL